MNNSNYISITEARKRLFQIVDNVQSPGQTYTLTEKGKPKAVLISVDEYESIKETFEIITESTNLKKEIKETDNAIQTGEYKKWTTFESLLAKEGFIFHDRRVKYEVSSSNKTKCRKAARKNTKS